MIRGNGRISFGAEQLAELKRNNRRDIYAVFRGSINVKRGVVAKLCMPLLGFLTTEVKFVIVNQGETALYIYCVDNILKNWDFDDDKEVLSQALTLILRNHKSQIISCYYSGD